MSESITTKLSTVDRIINIHQSVRLEQVKELNKAILNQQVKQNAQLAAMNKELAKSNSLQRQILENQIKEIEQREEQIFYKALSFNASELLDSILNIDNKLVQTYFLKNWSEKLKNNINQTIDKVVEISDKQYNKELLAKLQSLEKVTKEDSEFLNSKLNILDDLISDYNAKEKELKKLNQKPELDNSKVTIKPKINSLRVFGIVSFGILALIFALSFISALLEGKIAVGIVGFLVFFTPLFFLGFMLFKKEQKWRKNYPTYLRQQQDKQKSIEENNELIEKEYLKEISQKENLLKSHQLNNVLDEINQQFPNLNDIAEELIHIELNFKRKFGLIEESLSQTLIEQAAKVVVENQRISEKFLMEKLSVNYNVALKVGSELEKLGIIGPWEPRKKRQILIKNIIDLEKLLQNN